jgi:DNA modification methylase
MSTQFTLELTTKPHKLQGTYREKLKALLSGELDFHNQSSNYKSHNFHAFPAKFPPQLPRLFINELTNPDSIVLDPMAGSGTTVLEALLAHRTGIGFDIDPLAIRITSAKITPLSVTDVVTTGDDILIRARYALDNNKPELQSQIVTRWDEKTKNFVDYWFARETQLELIALILEIEKIPNPLLRAFFELVFSAIIVTKSGGVSLALDLAHTRPHRAKRVVTKSGRIIIEEESVSEKRKAVLTKILRPAFDEFEKRYKNNLDGLVIFTPETILSKVLFGNAEKLPLADDSIDLIVTSPPYASNAIDYMRAHKFSLVWMGYPIENLGGKRKEYIGGEVTANISFEPLPLYTNRILGEITKIDKKKSLVVRRYYSEMARVLREMYRVLKPGKASVVVVGNSVIRGVDTQTQNCLADIGQTIGFEIPKIGVRNLDRNRRMMPASMKANFHSQIQQRMHKEYVIGFYKPMT